MPRIDLLVESPRSRTPRARQLESMFDVPQARTSSREWHGEVSIEERKWNVGLIVGPSGSGKTQLAKQIFSIEQSDESFSWDADSVIDDIASSLSIDKVTAVCQAVGFNTVPAWLRPYRLLSTGEQFRAQIARALLESADPIVIDEFTSVVDRQVAKVAAFAIQKYIRHNDRKFVAVSCHSDVMEWLQPDWVLEPATMTFKWRSVQPRPSISVTVSRVHHKEWELFAPFHYMSASLSKSSHCYMLKVDETPAAFVGIVHRPHDRTLNLKGISRIVTLPDWQGLGLAFVLSDLMGSAYAALGYRLRNYPAHPPYIRSMDRSANWFMVKRPGKMTPVNNSKSMGRATLGGRFNAVFEYVGSAMNDLDVASKLTSVSPYKKRRQ